MDNKYAIGQEGGGARSEKKPSYDLIPTEHKRRLAAVLSRGEKNYGAFNWQGGGKEFVVDCWNHMEEHLLKWKDGNTDEDHIYHAICNLMFLAWFESQEPKSEAIERLKHK